MMKRIITLVLTGLICIAVVGAYAANEVRFPSPEGLVNDRAGVLSEKTKAQLGSLLGLIERKTSAEVVVLTVKTTRPLTTEQYAVELFQKWGIGKRGKDNGVLILLATEDRKVRIETGYGLEGAVTDAYAKVIIDTFMVPRFQKGDYDGGIIGGVIPIAQIIRDEYGVELDFKKEGLDLSEYTVRKKKSSPLSALVTLIFFILIFGFRFGTMFFIMSGSGGYWSGGSRGSFGGGFGGFGGGMSGGGGASGSW